MMLNGMLPTPSDNSLHETKHRVTKMYLCHTLYEASATSRPSVP
jgi:hypothetical protein